MGGRDGGRGVGGLNVRGGRFWEGNFGVVDGGQGWEEGFRLLFCFLDFFGRSSGGSYSSLSSQREGKGRGGERGEEGGEIREKGIQGWRGKEEEKDGGQKKGEMGIRNCHCRREGEERE